jgi:3-methyladenine DNA glycosylase Mpg
MLFSSFRKTKLQQVLCAGPGKCQSILYLKVNYTKIKLITYNRNKTFDEEQ